MNMIVMIYQELGLAWALVTGLSFTLIIIVGAYSAAGIIGFIKEG